MQFIRQWNQGGVSQKKMSLSQKTCSQLVLPLKLSRDGRISKMEWRGGLRALGDLFKKDMHENHPIQTFRPAFKSFFAENTTRNHHWAACTFRISITNACRRRTIPPSSRNKSGSFVAEPWLRGIHGFIASSTFVMGIAAPLPTATKPLA
jgi:hypothetical protein